MLNIYLGKNIKSKTTFFSIIINKTQKENNRHKHIHQKISNNAFLYQLWFPAPTQFKILSRVWYQSSHHYRHCQSRSVLLRQPFTRQSSSPFNQQQAGSRVSYRDDPGRTYVHRRRFRRGKGEEVRATEVGSF